MAAKNKARPVTPTPQRKATPAAKSASAPVELTHLFEGGFWRKHWFPALFFISLSLALYGASISYRYVLDDEMVIGKNVFVQKGVSGWKDIFGYDSFMGYFQKKESLYKLEGGRYRPLSLATFALETSLFGPDKPWIAHLINILLYGFTGILLYRILLGLFPAKEGGQWYFSVPFLASALFILHPLHSECVANIKGRDEILALLGSLGALYATLKYFDTNSRVWYWLSGVFLLLGLLSKENAITFVAIIPLTAYFFTRLPWSRILSASIPLFAAAFVFIVIRYMALGYMLDHGKAVKDLMNNSFVGMNIGEKYATILLTLGWYVKLLFVPYPLTHDYYPYHVPKVTFADWRALASLALYAGLIFWAWTRMRSRNIPAYAIWFFLITLSIVSNLVVSVGAFMNERFVYMPSVGFCILAAWFLARQLPIWLKNAPDRATLAALAILLPVSAAFAWITIQRVPAWKDGMSLNTAAIKVSYNSARAHCFYATALYRDSLAEIKDMKARGPLLDVIEQHIKKSLEINPKYGSAWLMYANCATARFQIDNDVDKLFSNLERCFKEIPYHPNFKENIDKYLEYYEDKPQYAEKFNTLVYNVGYGVYLKGDIKPDPKSAIRVLEHGLATGKNDPRVLDALAQAYEANGEAAKAADIRRGLPLAPSSRGGASQ